VANGSASPIVKPLVDYPDDDEEDAMDTKPEQPADQPAEAQPLTVGDIQVEPSPEPTTSEPTSPTAQTPPPERLAEKRRREEEDEDELVKLAAGPKRRSSTSSNSGAGILTRKKALSIGSIGSVEKSGTQGVLGTVTSAPPKRIAINLGPVKPSVSDDASCGDTVSSESNEKENRDDSQGAESG
jgi:protein phosphatase-4 regulatory subunit 3